MLATRKLREFLLEDVSGLLLLLQGVDGVGVFARSSNSSHNSSPERSAASSVYSASPDTICSSNPSMLRTSYSHVYATNGIRQSWDFQSGSSPVRRPNNVPSLRLSSVMAQGMLSSALSEAMQEGGVEEAEETSDRHDAQRDLAAAQNLPLVRRGAPEAPEEEREGLFSDPGAQVCACPAPARPAVSIKPEQSRLNPLFPLLRGVPCLPPPFRHGCREPGQGHARQGGGNPAAHVPPGKRHQPHEQRQLQPLEPREWLQHPEGCEPKSAGGHKQTVVSAPEAGCRRRQQLAEPCGCRAVKVRPCGGGTRGPGFCC